MNEQEIIQTSQEADVIKFQKNWNRKLNCDYFTSIRLASPKYKTGKVFRLLLMENGIYRDMGYARIISVKSIRLNQINDLISYSCKGMDPARIQDALYFKYKDFVRDIGMATFYVILFERIKVDQKQGQLF